MNVFFTSDRFAYESLTQAEADGCRVSTVKQHSTYLDPQTAVLTFYDLQTAGLDKSSILDLIA